MGRVLICFLLFVIFCDKPFIRVIITWSLLFKLSMFSCLSTQNLLSDAEMLENILKHIVCSNLAYDVTEVIDALADIL